MIEIEINGVKLKCYENGDIEYFYKKKWCKASDKLNKGYKRIHLNGKSYLQHRILYKAFNPDFDINSKLDIDHINRFRNDNHLENLRAITHQQNLFNTNAKGYSRNREKWEGRIKVNGKSISKRFDTESEARDWRLEQKKLLHIIK